MPAHEERDQRRGSARLAHGASARAGSRPRPRAPEQDLRRWSRRTDAGRRPEVLVGARARRAAAGVQQRPRRPPGRRPRSPRARPAPRRRSAAPGRPRSPRPQARPTAAAPSTRPSQNAPAGELHRERGVALGRGADARGQQPPARVGVEARGGSRRGRTRSRSRACGVERERPPAAHGRLHEPAGAGQRAAARASSPARGSVSRSGTSRSAARTSAPRPRASSARRLGRGASTATASRSPTWAERTTWYARATGPAPRRASAAAARSCAPSRQPGAAPS